MWCSGDNKLFFKLFYVLDTSALELMEERWDGFSVSRRYPVMACQILIAASSTHFQVIIIVKKEKKGRKKEKGIPDCCVSKKAKQYQCPIINLLHCDLFLFLSHFSTREKELSCSVNRHKYNFRGSSKYAFFSIVTCMPIDSMEFNRRKNAICDWALVVGRLHVALPESHFRNWHLFIFNSKMQLFETPMHTDLGNVYTSAVSLR